MNSTDILCIVGARPNFMKISPIMKALGESKVLNGRLLHTGQHFDEHMSELFFNELEISKPEINLEVGPDPINIQTGKIFIKLDPYLRDIKPAAVLVVGDVTSTFISAVTASRYSIPVAHVEAGLRSNDRTMPEEINRIITDSVADFLFTTSPEAGKNLKREGISSEKIFFVGNVMIDTLYRFRERAESSDVLNRFNLTHSKYAVCTLHRPSNVDDKSIFEKILLALENISLTLPILLPLHPRTRACIEKFGLNDRIAGLKDLIVTEPLGYLDFLCALSNAKLVLTDSGGIQEETTVLGIPCLTLRENTERPVTITEGTNELVGSDTERILIAFDRIISGNIKTGRHPELWDGNAAKRIVNILEKYLLSK